jgi:hypothetical protein
MPHDCCLGLDREYSNPKEDFDPQRLKFANLLCQADLFQCYAGILSELVRRKWTRDDLDTLPFGVALPLRHILRTMRDHPSPPNWPQAALVLIGKEVGEISSLS